jgi:hypothetical protein
MAKNKCQLTPSQIRRFGDDISSRVFTNERSVNFLDFMENVTKENFDDNLKFFFGVTSQNKIFCG